MCNRFNIFSFGFVLLISSIVISVSCAIWAFSPLDKEKAYTEEMVGRILYTQENFDEAFSHFLAAAEIDDIPRRQSTRYQWAGETCNSLIGKIFYFRRGYTLNPDDDFFVDQLKNTPILNALIIEDQSMNDLTLEEWRLKALAMWPDSIEEIFAMYADTSNKEEIKEEKSEGRKMEKNIE